MTTKTRIILLIAIVILFAAAAFGMSGERGTNGVIFKKITTFEECVSAGNSVMESFPRQCRSKSGELFVEDTTGPSAQHDLIRLDSPEPNEAIKSPLVVRGEARGGWYFEATFPVVLTDWNGLIIAEGYASADGEWMTSDFVPFSATIEFETPPYGERGSLILQKANPSDLSEHDDALEIPIRFADAPVSE